MSVTLHTDVGDIKVELFCELCPKTCENFLALCASNYYNDCFFHRNIKVVMVGSGLMILVQMCTPEPGTSTIAAGNILTGFIVQTGDPTGTGKGGNSIWGKKFPDEFKDELKHTSRGMLSMANNGSNTNGSQFFFTYAEQPHLDLKYTLFGRIIDGFEALDELEKLPVKPKSYRPLTEVRITAVTIHANPLAA